MHDVDPRRAAGPATVLRGRALGHSPAVGRVLALAAATCFAMNGTISKLVLQAGMPADRLTALRSAGAALVLLAVVGATRPTSLRVRKTELPVLIACGLAGVALVQWLYFIAIARLPVGVALLLEFTAPVLVALWVRFGLPIRGRRPVAPRVWAALALVVVGMAVLAQVWDGMTLDPIGLLAGIGSSAALAAFFLLSERAVAGRDGLSFAALLFAVGAVAWALVRPWWSFPIDLLGGTSGGIPVWLLCIGVVVVGTVLPYLLTFAGLRRLGATDASVVGTAEPLLAGLVAWAALGEVLSPIQLLGGAVVLGGILLAQTAPRRARQEPGAPASN